MLLPFFSYQLSMTLNRLFNPLWLNADVTLCGGGTAVLKKALDYDKDTEDAFAAGEIQGRNTNINKMRTKASDGLPTGLSSQAAPAVERPKVRRNSLIADALNA